MNSRILLCAISTIMCFAIQAADDKQKAPEKKPEWFIKFEEKYNTSTFFLNQSRMERWCAMLNHLPSDIRIALIVKLTQETHNYHYTIYKYAIKTKEESVRLYKGDLIAAIAELIVQEQINPLSFDDDIFKRQSFQIMLNELQEMSMQWWPGEKVVTCINALLEIFQS